MLRIAIDRCLELRSGPSAGALSGARSGEHTSGLIGSAPQTRSGSNFAGLKMRLIHRRMWHSIAADSGPQCL